VSDPDNDPVTLTASIGSVTNNNDGTWSWSFDTSDGPGESQTVYIDADDGNGGTAQTSFELTVNNAAPTITSLVASASMVCGQDNSVTINFSDPALANDTYTADVDWGDGNTDSYSGVSSGHVASHAYALAGQYTVSVTVSDEDGGISDAETTTLTLNYTVVGGGVQQPINQDGSSVFKFKSTIPVKV
jgi:hypothetical protein